MTPAQRIRSDWKAALARISYGAIVNNIPYFAFIALLGVVYISCNTTAVERQREIEKEQVALKELRWRYMDTKTRLMATGVEAEVIRRSAAIGLKPLMLPAYTIPKENGITDFPEPSQTTAAK
jgi:hypothetical protein